MTDRDNQLAWLRGKRQLSGVLDPKFGFQTTVFLGLYEGGKYLQSRLEDVRKQNTQSFYLLVVDNYSSDFDRHKFVEEIEASNLAPGTWQLVRNPTNLGGLGSFQLNLDLIPSEWITAMHQDDHYKENHVNSHLLAMSEAERNVLTISSDMGSLDSSGKQVGAFPRASWFLPSSERHEVFVANVAMQIIPYPALSMRKNFAQLDSVPWHSAAFSDSELTLRSLMEGRHVFVKAETMLYRENPESESRLQGIEIRSHSATLGLMRIFGSPSFISFAAELAPERRAAFAKKLQHSIQIRLPEPEKARLMEALVLEQLCHAWGYRVSETLQALSDLFLSKNQSYSADLLGGLSKLIARETATGSSPTLAPSSSANDDLEPTQLGQELPYKKSAKNQVLHFCLSVAGLLPYALRRELYRFVVRLFTKIRPGSKWDFNW